MSTPRTCPPLGELPDLSDDGDVEKARSEKWCARGEASDGIATRTTFPGVETLPVEAAFASDGEMAGGGAKKEGLKMLGRAGVAG